MEYSMKLNMRFAMGAFFALAVAVSSCDTFKDEITPKSYSEAVKNIDGNWQLSAVARNKVDITKAMDFTRFHLVLNKDNTYELKNYLPFIVKGNGSWSVDDPLYPFHLSFKEKDAEEGVKTSIGFQTVDGKRQMTITLSPGCHSNEYVYTFKQVTE